jgi:hypothetical protein
VVVEGLLDFETERLDTLEDQIATEILAHLQKFFPSKAAPWQDPASERMIEFDLAVRSAAEQIESRGGPMPKRGPVRSVPER